MEQIETFLKRLPARHRTALRWFSERAREEHPWPVPIETGIIYVSAPTSR